MNNEIGKLTYLIDTKRKEIQSRNELAKKELENEKKTIESLEVKKRLDEQNEIQRRRDIVSNTGITKLLDELINQGILKYSELKPAEYTWNEDGWGLEISFNYKKDGDKYEYDILKANLTNNGLVLNNNLVKSNQLIESLANAIANPIHIQGEKAWVNKGGIPGGY